jgi:hypothetical protein
MLVVNGFFVKGFMRFRPFPRACATAGSTKSDKCVARTDRHIDCNWVACRTSGYGIESGKADLRFQATIAFTGITLYS